MAASGGSIGFSGSLTLKKQAIPMAPISWRMRNAMKWSYIWGFACFHLARWFSKVTKVPTITARLRLRKKLVNGTWVDYGWVSYRMVTNAGVAFLVDDWDPTAATDMSTMKYHGVGTGAGVEAVGDVALTTECTTALNPDSTRATGVATQPSANILRSTATLTFDAASTAVIEHGLFSQAATGGGTLWDRSVFAVVTMLIGESLQCQYDGTVNAGG